MVKLVPPTKNEEKQRTENNALRGLFDDCVNAVALFFAKVTNTVLETSALSEEQSLSIELFEAVHFPTMWP